MELRVNDYVRTKQGYIRQIKEIYDHILYYVNLDKSITMERYGKFEPITQLDRDTIDEIIKSSPNIIDLIKYGDIVKHKINDEDFISEVWGEDNNYFIVVYDRAIDIGELNIVSVVTKEAFEEMEYKI